jgi:hypothetical protein
MNRLRPRFSLRTLAIVVTLVCAYFAAWEITTNYAESLTSALALPTRVYSRDGNQLLWDEPTFSDDFSMKHKLLGTKMYYITGARSPCPLIVIQDEAECDYMGNDTDYRCSYYLWLLGLNVKLPYESTL